MSDLAPDQPVLLHAVVERVVGSLVELRAGNSTVQAVAADIVEAVPQRVRWCGNDWTVIGQDGSHLGIRRNGIRLWTPAGECTPVEA